jgi:2,3-bisphosphoglycerate-independent phosphoglycerate mutase
MKFAVLILAGATDEPVADLDARTPLQAAATPGLDELAASGRLGMASILPPDSEPLGEALLMSVLGYDPREFIPARGPIEALAHGVRLGRPDRAFRVNLVTVRDGRLLDAGGGFVGDREAAELLSALRPGLPPELELHAGQSYRHLLVWRGCGALGDLVTRPPHTCVGQSVDRNLPRGRGAEVLLDLMQRSPLLLDEHDVNAVRRELGEQPANALWPHGGGVLPAPPSFESRFGVRGQMIAGAPLARGLARLLRLRVGQDAPAGGRRRASRRAAALAAAA